MPVCFLAPDPLQSTFLLPGGNTPGNGVQVFFYVSGSSTKQTAYKDPAGSVAWANPTVLDSGGNFPLGGEVWFPTGQTFTVKFCPANDSDPPASPYRTLDNLSGVNDVSASSSEWQSGPTPTFISATSFSLAGDQRTTFTLGRRVRTTNTGGTVYSTITSTTFGGGITTVRVVNDSGSLDAGLSAVSYGLLDPANSSIDFYHVGKDGGTVTSWAAGTTDIWGIKGSELHLNVTNTIFSFSSAAYAGAERVVIVDSAGQINTSATLSLPGNQNVSTAPGDRFGVLASTAAAAIVTFYQPGNGVPFASPQPSNLFFAGPNNGSTGVPTFRVLGANDVPATAGGALVLIQTTTVVNASTVQFRSLPGNIDDFSIEMSNVVPVTDTTNLNLQMSTSNAASFTIAGYGYSGQGRSTNNSTLAVSAVTSAINIGGYPSIVGLSNSFGAGGFSGTITLKKLSTVNQDKSVYISGVGAHSAGGVVTASYYGMGISSDAGLRNASVNALQISCQSGNISSATFSLYGRKTT